MGGRGEGGPAPIGAAAMAEDQGKAELAFEALEDVEGLDVGEVHGAGGGLDGAEGVDAVEELAEAAAEELFAGVVGAVG